MLYVFIVGLFVIFGILFLSSVQFHHNLEDDCENVFIEDKKENYICGGWSCDYPPEYLRDENISNQCDYGNSQSDCIHCTNNSDDNNGL